MTRGRGGTVPTCARAPRGSPPPCARGRAGTDRPLCMHACARGCPTRFNVRRFLNFRRYLHRWSICCMMCVCVRAREWVRVWSICCCCSRRGRNMPPEMPTIRSTRCDPPNRWRRWPWPILEDARAAAEMRLACFSRYGRVVAGTSMACDLRAQARCTMRRSSPTTVSMYLSSCISISRSA